MREDLWTVIEALCRWRNQEHETCLHDKSVMHKHGLQRCSRKFCPVLAAAGRVLERLSPPQEIKVLVPSTSTEEPDTNK